MVCNMVLSVMDVTLCRVRCWLRNVMKCCLTLCNDMLCHIVSHYAMSCCFMLYDVMLCSLMLWIPVACYAIMFFDCTPYYISYCHDTRWLAMLCLCYISYAMLYNVIFHVVSFDLLPDRIVLCYVMLCFVTLCCAMLCHVI